MIRKWYAPDVVQHEAGEPETKGFDTVVQREKNAFDNYFDWDRKIEGPRVIIHGQYVAGNVTFTDHTFRGAFKGMEQIYEARQLTEQHWDLKTGKLIKEVFWHTKPKA